MLVEVETEHQLSVIETQLCAETLSAGASLTETQRQGEPGNTGRERDGERERGRGRGREGKRSNLVSWKNEQT